jgi:hypothetical protein
MSHNDTTIRINWNRPLYDFLILTAVDMKTYLLGYNAVQSVGGQPTFRRKNMTSMLATCFMFVSCLAYSSIAKMEATYSSLMSFGFQRTARPYITENRTLNKYVFTASFDCIYLETYNGISAQSKNCGKTAVASERLWNIIRFWATAAKQTTDQHTLLGSRYLISKYTRAVAE